MSSPAKTEFRRGAIRLVTAGIGAAIAGPLGAALGGTVGGILAEHAVHLLNEHTAELLSKGAEHSGEALSEFGVHYCYDKFQEKGEHPLEEVVRRSLGFGLEKVRVSLDSDLRTKYAGWFENWELRLSAAEQLPLEPLLLRTMVEADALQALDSLFKRTLERLDGEGRSQQAIKKGKMSSVVGSDHFRDIPEDLLRLVIERLPEPFDEHLRELLAAPENDRAWKTVGLDFQRYARGRLDGIDSKVTAVYSATQVILERLPVREEIREPSGPAISIAKLPTVNPLLIGREAELKKLDEAWGDPKINLVSIVAFGGVGKTSLAINWWHRNQALGAKRILGWSFYSQGAAEDRQASAEPFLDHALREWFGVTDPPKDSWARGEKLAELIRRERTLLILDGLEPIQFPPGPQVSHFKDPGMEALLRELSIHNPGLCVCTSRLSLTDLDGPGTREIDLDPLTPEFGAEYLRVLGVQGPDEELRKASEDFDNHALALTLLGNLLVKRYKGDIYKRDTIPTVLAEHKQGAHARRVLRQYEALFKGKPELEVLRILGLFDRPADKGALKILRKLSANVWAEALESLKDARLIEYEDLDGPLDCHPLIREHFAEEYRASKPEEFRAAQAQLYEYYSKLAPERPDTLEEMTPLFHAVYHGCKAGKQREVHDGIYFGRILRGEAFFLTRKLGAFATDLSLLANFFAAPWSESSPSLPLNTRSSIAGTAAFALRALGRLKEAVEPMNASAIAVVSREHWGSAAIALGNLSELHLALGDAREAIDAARRSVETADKSGDEFQRRVNRTTLADALHQFGDPVAASALFQEAEKMQAEQQPEFPILYSLPGYRYWDLLFAQGESEEILRRAMRTLPWHRRQGWLLDIALDHLSLGRAHAPGSAEAARHLDEAVSALRRAGQLQELPRGLLARAAHFRHTREWDKAQHDLDEVRALATRCGMRLFLTDYHLEKARLLIDQQRQTEAKPHYEAAKKLVEETGYHRRDAELLQIAGDLG